MAWNGTGTAPDYRVLMDAVEKVLRDGPQTTAQLATLFPDYPRWQLNNVIGYLGAIREKGETPYAPSTIWHPKDKNAPASPVDTWLKERLAQAPVASAVLSAEALDRDVAKATLSQAYKRLGITAQKSDGRWYKCLPGQSIVADKIELTTFELNAGVTEVAAQLLSTDKFMEIVERIYSFEVDAQRQTTIADTNKRVRQFINYGAAHGLFEFHADRRTYTLTELGQAVAEYARDMTWSPGMTAEDVEAEAEK